MKKNYLYRPVLFVFILFLTSSYSSAYGQSSQDVSLLNFLVYAKQNMLGHGGDFEGLTGAGGNVEFKHWAVRNYFLPREPQFRSELELYSVFAGGLFSMGFGSLSNQVHSEWGLQWAVGHVDACRVEVVRQEGAPTVNFRNSQTREFCPQSASSLVDHNSLSQQMDQLSGILKAQAVETVTTVTALERYMGTPALVLRGRGNLNLFNIHVDLLSQAQNVVFLGGSRQTFVVNVVGQGTYNMKGVGFYLRTLNGEVSSQFAPQPGRLFFNFVDVQEINVSMSGANDGELGRNVGIPVSVVAPKARFTMSHSLITGAVYVGSYYGPINSQVNHVCLKGMEDLGIDWYCDCFPYQKQCDCP